MLKLLLGACTAALMLDASTAFAAPAKTEPMVLYAKQSASLADLQSTLSDCKSGVKRNVGSTAAAYPTVVGAVSLPAVVGVVIGTSIADAYWSAQWRAPHIVTCMRSHGFAELSLTDAEAATYLSLAESERGAWHGALLKGDISERVTAALKPRVEPMPTAADEPYVVAGVRLNPGRLTLATGDVSAGGALVSGRAGYRRAARLTTDAVVGVAPIGMMAMAVIKIPPNAPFHQTYAGRPQQSDFAEERTFWCGPSVHPKRKHTMCIGSRHHGYLTIIGEGQPWLGQPAPANLLYDVNGRPMEIKFEEVEPESLGDFAVELRAESISKKGVELRGIAQRDGEESQFYSAIVYFDATGVARLPFWDRTLELSKAGRNLSVRYTPRIDGLGWYDLGETRP